MLSSIEHEISIARKTKLMQIKDCSLKLSDVVFVLLINVKMPTIVGILTCISRINFRLHNPGTSSHFLSEMKDQDLHHNVRAKHKAPSPRSHANKPMLERHESFHYI